MFLSHLSLANFRGYKQLDIQLPAPVVLFQGDNGQGKTNLLEAVYFLATTRSLRAGSDRELINWFALEEPIPFARVEGAIRKAHGELKVEIVIRADKSEQRHQPLIEGGPPPLELSKRIKINGVPKRAMELIGLVNVVMFSPQDLELVTGAPALRRRYLDIVNSQVDHRYFRTLQQYTRVLAQRNHLLKQIRDNQQPPDVLEFWSEELVKSGAYILHRRLNTVAALNRRVDGYFHRITASGKQLKISYHSSVADAVGEWETRRRGDAETRGDTGIRRPVGAGGPAGPPPLGEEAQQGEGATQNPEPIAQDSGPRTQDPGPSAQHRDGAESETEAVEHQTELFRAALARYRRREVLQGVSLVGPHRDDITFRADGIDMNVYGSRGEQRAVALALKLSEVQFMQAFTGEQPILLLDDVMSELDPSRRGLLMEALNPSGQTLISATDLQSFSPEFLSRASLFTVNDGTVTPLVYPGK